MLKLVFVTLGYLALILPLLGFVVIPIWALITLPIQLALGERSAIGNFAQHAVSGVLLSFVTISYFYLFGYRTFWPALIFLNWVYWNNPGSKISISLEPRLTLYQKLGFGFAVIACLYFSMVLLPGA